MACLRLKPGAQLPTLPAGLNFSPPGFAFPAFDAALCCKIHIPIPIAISFGNPLTANPAFLTALNFVIAQVQAYLDQVDALDVGCPLE